MGGDISFHSQPNRGSTFWFHIPASISTRTPFSTLNTGGLVGKTRLAYVKPTRQRRNYYLEMLAATPLERLSAALPSPRWRKRE
ncbi:hypothetical protein MJ575_23355 [Klebsiella pneumoniae]|nr:hypothetical protein MJ575_23355 [Klebsiella pneumoniae]